MGFICAAIVLEPGGIIAWLVVGLVAGWLAGVVMKGGGYDVVGDPRRSEMRWRRNASGWRTSAGATTS